LSPPVLVWFRDDHRLSDNPAFTAALATGSQVLCFFVLDEASKGFRSLGSAARWWLHGSLGALAKALGQAGAPLIILKGPASEIVPRIVAEAGASAIFWNRRYGAAEITLDSAITKHLTAQGVRAQSFNGRLIHEPWEIKNRSDRAFQVFTPYLQTVMTRTIPAPLPPPKWIRAGTWPSSILKTALALEELGLEPSTPDWAAELRTTWQRGERAAQHRLSEFLDNGLQGYAEKRDVPGLAAASRLSPHLRFGEISPRQIWHVISDASAREPSLERDAVKFRSELIWRDFTYQLLHDNPHLPHKPHSGRFEHFPWSEDRQTLNAWQRGRTGYPIVDAGMRQLWRTGWMHNRVRMIVGSFLVKHLLTDWRQGEAWFWDTLVDADAANYAFNWQWIAGSGPDSAPFHRIFNPITQGEKFDSDGGYVRAFVPELAGLPSAFIHKPWEASPHVLHAAGIRLGETYPVPIVPHGPARECALAAFRSRRNPTT
jgi:deoxyribodipyrimidine photo-lyase